MDNIKYMKYMSQLDELAQLGIEIHMKTMYIFEVYGFYKSGTVLVDIQDETVTARYDEVSTIYDEDLIQTLVDVNYDWWQRSMNRHDGWRNPDSNWESLLAKYGMIRIEYETVKRYVTN